MTVFALLCSGIRGSAIIVSHTRPEDSYVCVEGRNGDPGHSIRVDEALARVPGSKGERYADVFKHGSLSVEIFAPRGVDNQQPHTRDEVYVVVHGSGRFAFGNERVTFGPGDFLFVPAGVAHRFEDFTEDFVVWVLFYGPEGGENPSGQTQKGD